LIFACLYPPHLEKWGIQNFFFRLLRSRILFCTPHLRIRGATPAKEGDRQREETAETVFFRNSAVIVSLTDSALLSTSQDPKQRLGFNHLMGTSKTHNNGPLYYSDWYTAWPLMGGLLHLVQRGGNWAGMQQCTNFILFNVALQLPLHQWLKVEHQR